MKKISLVVATTVLIFLGVNASFAQKVKEKYDIMPTKIGVYEHLDAVIPKDIFLINNIDSSKVNVSDLVNKPTIFSFVYYSCPGLCSPLLGGVSEAIEKMDLELGIDYQVLTISFNPDDRPSLGIAKKRNYVDAIENRKISEKDWIWLTGDSTNIAKITNALGFQFEKNGEDYAHAATIIVVSPKKKITRYLYGTYFLPFDVKMAILEAQDEKSSPTINKVLQFCFSYDPKGKKYVFNITRVSASVILFGAALLLFFLVFSKRKRRKFGDSK